MVYSVRDLENQEYKKFDRSDEIAWETKPGNGVTIRLDKYDENITSPQTTTLSVDCYRKKYGYIFNIGDELKVGATGDEGYEKFIQKFFQNINTIGNIEDIISTVESTSKLKYKRI